MASCTRQMVGLIEDVKATAQPRSTQLKLFASPNPLSERIGAGFFRTLPAEPGVYRFYGSDNRLLYIGQSNDLRARVGSYRHVVPERHPRRTLRLVGRIARIEWEVCPTAEAAIELERVLLLELRPPFNRAGVWQGSPWWFHTEEVEGCLVAQISREAIEGGIGPVPSPFRHAFGAMMRCTFRSLAPELGLACYPLGLLNHTIPLTVRWKVPNAGAIVASLCRWVGGESDELHALLGAVEPQRQVTEWEQEYWLEQLDVLAKYWKKHRLGQG